MKIAMLCSGHAVDDARVTYKQAGSLARAGHDVIVFGQESGDFACPRLTLKRIAPRHASLRKRAGLVRVLAREAIAWGPDVVTCHEPESVVAGLRVRAATGCKVIFDVHELFHESLSSRLIWPLGPAVRAGSIYLLRELGRRVDWVTVVSPPNQRFYGDVRHDGRVDIIHNSPKVDEFLTCSQDTQGPVLICHEGDLNPGRGMTQMLEALAIARRQADVRMLILGRVEKAYQAQYDQLVARHGLADAIEGPKWIKYNLLGQEVARAQIGIVAMQPTPNNYGSLSNKIYSYMACGHATVVPKGSATSDLVLGEQAGIAVDTTNPEAIAEAFVRLAKDPDLRSQLGANGRRAIMEKYGWHKMEERLLDIYAQLERELQQTHP